MSAATEQFAVSETRPAWSKPDLAKPTAEQDALINKYQQVGADLEPRLQAIQTDKDIVAEDILGAEPPPAPPQSQPLPGYQARQIDAEEMNNFGMIATAMAALGTKAVRGDVALALNTAASAMKGFQEGNIQQTKLDIENFNTKMREVQAKNKQMMTDYEAVINNRKLTLGEKMQQWRILANQHQDEIALAGLKQNNIRGVYDMLESRRRADNQLEVQLSRVMASWQAAVERASATRARGLTVGAPNSLTQEALDNYAQYIILNGRMPIGLSRIGPEAIQSVMNRTAELVQQAGLTKEDFAAAGPITRQKLGALMQLEKNRNAVQAYEGMLIQNIDILKDLSKEVERTDSAYVNAPILWLKQNVSGDPKVSEYLFQVNTVATEIARVLNNPNLTGQLTDTARKELESVVRGELNPRQLEAVLNRSQADARNRAKSFDSQVQKVIMEIRDPLHKGEAGGGAMQDFATEEAARAAGKKNGDRVRINGVSGTLR